MLVADVVPIDGHDIGGLQQLVCRLVAKTFRIAAITGLHDYATAIKQADCVDTLHLR